MSHFPSDTCLRKTCKMNLAICSPIQHNPTNLTYSDSMFLLSSEPDALVLYASTRGYFDHPVLLWNITKIVMHEHRRILADLQCETDFTEPHSKIGLVVAISSRPLMDNAMSRGHHRSPRLFFIGPSVHATLFHQICEKPMRWSCANSEGGILWWIYA